MADKKITDLQLRSNFNDDVNLPVDDGIQTYRCTGPQIQDYITARRRSPFDALNYSLAASVASSALTIALKDAAGNNAQTSSPVSIAFRHATASNGLPVIRSVTAALSTVISSGSTAGHTNGVPNYLYVYALDNSGTVELAWSSRRWDEGSLHSTTAEGGAGAADDKDTLYSTNSRSNVPIRFLGRMKVTETTAGTWAAVPTEISLKPSNINSNLENEVFVSNGSGFGSTGTTIRTYSNVNKNVGSAITYLSDGVNGDSFTVNEDGLYHISTIDYGNSGIHHGISVNSADLTQSIGALSYADGFRGEGYWAGTDHCAGCTTSLYLHAGDVVRAQGSGNALANQGDQIQWFRIVKG